MPEGRPRSSRSRLVCLPVNAWMRCAICWKGWLTVFPLKSRSK